LSPRQKIWDKIFILAPGCTLWSPECIVPGPVTRQNLMAERVWQRNAAHLMVARKERDRQTDRQTLGTKYAPLGHSSFLHLVPTS
jgi:hypothetical protein